MHNVWKIKKIKAHIKLEVKNHGNDEPMPNITVDNSDLIM